jgi:hypothetical protein
MSIIADIAQAPMTPDVKISYHEQMFNSTLFGTSIYRQEPSPEVDQAWVDIGVYCESNSAIFNLEELWEFFFAPLTNTDV